MKDEDYFKYLLKTVHQKSKVKKVINNILMKMVVKNCYGYMLDVGCGVGMQMEMYNEYMAQHVEFLGGHKCE